MKKFASDGAKLVYFVLASATGTLLGLNTSTTPKCAALAFGWLFVIFLVCVYRIILGKVMERLSQEAQMNGTEVPGWEEYILTDNALFAVTQASVAGAVLFILTAVYSLL